MTHVRRFDHVGITVSDLDRARAFFEAIGLVADEPADIEGDFLDTVIGIANSQTRIIMMRLSGADTTVELSSFARPDLLPAGNPSAANEVGLRSIAFEVDDIQAAVDHLAELGHGLVGRIGQFEDLWKMAYVSGPDGIIVALAERLNA